MREPQIGDLKAASERRMARFESMPEEWQALSRTHGGMVDDAWSRGWTLEAIISHLKKLGRIG